MLTGKGVVSYILEKEGFLNFEVKVRKNKSKDKNNKDIIYAGELKYQHKEEMIIELEEEYYEGNQGEHIASCASQAALAMIYENDKIHNSKATKAQRMDTIIFALVFIINVIYPIITKPSLYNGLIFIGSMILYLKQSSKQKSIIKLEDTESYQLGRDLLKKHISAMLHHHDDMRDKKTLIETIDNYFESTLRSSIELRQIGIKIIEVRFALIVLIMHLQLAAVFKDFSLLF